MTPDAEILALSILLDRQAARCEFCGLWSEWSANVYALLDSTSSRTRQACGKCANEGILITVRAYDLGKPPTLSPSGMTELRGESYLERRAAPLTDPTVFRRHPYAALANRLNRYLRALSIP
jgi:hypothetical protein